MKRISVFSTKHVQKMLEPVLAPVFSECGIQATFHKDYKNYTQICAEVDGLITWGVKISHGWYERLRKPVLYLENGLFCQNEGFFIDDKGWYDDSSIVQDREYNNPAKQANLARLHLIASKRLSFTERWYPADCQRPIVVAYQHERDATIRHKTSLFPVFKQKMPGMTFLLSTIYPDTKVLLRPHPRFRKHFDSMIREQFSGNFALPKMWEIDRTPSVYDKIPYLRAIITCNSTIATEALYWGIPVATFGRSAYRGSGCVFELADSKNHTEDLAKFDGFIPPKNKIDSYLSAILDHQIPFSKPDSILDNPYFMRWMSRLTGETFT